MNSVSEALARATLFRFASLLWAPPRSGDADDAGLEELAGLAGALPADFGDVAKNLLATLCSSGPDPAQGDRSSIYHAVLGPSGACRDCESDFSTNPLGGKGPLLADVAGFYRAFAYDPEDDLPAAPDHVAIELGFVGYLAMKEAYALYSGQPEAAARCAAARDLFIEEHLRTWIPAFCDQVDAAAPEGFFVRAAQFTRSAVPAPPSGR